MFVVTSVSRSTPGVYTSLVAMTDKVGKFVEKKSKVGTKAKVTCIPFVA